MAEAYSPLMRGQERFRNVYERHDGERPPTIWHDTRYSATSAASLVTRECNRHGLRTRVVYRLNVRFK